VKTAEKTVATCMKSAAEMAAEKCQSILGARLDIVGLMVIWIFHVGKTMP
jgi:hypothetical protein